MEKNGFLLIGKIVGVHGLNGNLKVYSYAESLSVFERDASIFVISKNDLKKFYTVQWAQPHGRLILLSLEGITSHNDAQALVGSELFIEKERLPELEDGFYYWFDLIGLAVYTTENKYIGRVESIIATGSNDVYVVKNTKIDPDHEILIPALESVVLEIDLNHKTMRVDLPEGL
ncbi:MAG: ribosome maturation factor RimM [Proteobacteria bacterium]|nr:ribosome maturation factor RimM [Pseudomonadota bacterium]